MKGLFELMCQEFFLMKESLTIKKNSVRIKTEKNENLLKAFIQVAKADGVLHPREIKLLQGIGRKIGFNESEISMFIHNSDDISASLASNMSDKLSLMMDFFRLAIADGNLKQSEIDIIKSFALKLGYSEENFNELVELTIQQLNIVQSA